MTWVYCGVSASVAIGSSMAGATASKEASHDANMAYKSASNKALRLMNLGYDKAITYAKNYAELAQKFQDPYVEMGKKAISWFDKYQNEPGFMSNMYDKYSKKGDSLYDYWQGKQSKALDRRLVAIGKYGSGAGTEAHSDQESTLSAKMAELTDSRVNREIDTQMKLLSSGQSAANNSTNLQWQLGTRLGDLEAARGTRGAAQMTSMGEVATQAINASGASDTQMWGNIGSLASTFAGGFAKQGWGGVTGAKTAGTVAGGTPVSGTPVKTGTPTIPITPVAPSIGSGNTVSMNNTIDPATINGFDQYYSITANEMTRTPNANRYPGYARYGYLMQ